MRAFALLFGLMVLALVSIGVFTYPAWLLVDQLVILSTRLHAALAAIGISSYPAWMLQPHFDFKFHRVGERIGMLAAAIGFFVMARRMGLWDKQTLGYGLRRPLFIRQLLAGLAQGALSMALLVVIMTLLGLLDWSDASVATAGKITKIVLNRLLSGLAVGLIEETFFRGAMFSGIQRESGLWPAVILTSIVYSATHFFASFHIEYDQVNSSSGLALLGGTLHLFANPLAIADAFICLFAVGAVLALVRYWTGNIALGMGLHAGWVWVMLVTHELTKPVRDQPLSFLLSQFDGFVGWLVLIGTIVQGVFLWMIIKRHARTTAA
jgi:hypothetical protein